MKLTIERRGNDWVAYTFGSPWICLVGKTKREVTENMERAIRFYCQHLMRQIPTTED